MKRREQIDLAAESAAFWVVQLQEDDSEATRNEFCAWARQSPLHIQEFLAASEELERVGMLVQSPAGQKLDVTRLLEASRTNVIALDQAEPAGAPAPPAGNVWLRVAAACAVLVIATVAWAILGISRPQSYSTAVGDQRTIKLADGSVIQLNADSEVSVQYSNERRKILLARGEALFTVAHDASRPFDVDTGNGVIRAVGTQFNVYRRAQGTTVTVVEGTVQVSSALVATPMLATAGDRVELQQHTAIKETNPDQVAKALAWRERRLKFRDQPLQEVASEFNRYNTRQIVVSDADARQKSLSGVFDADRPEALLKFLALDPTLAVEETQEGFVVRSVPQSGQRMLD